jgi:hypothetical protein
MFNFPSDQFNVLYTYTKFSQRYDEQGHVEYLGELQISCAKCSSLGIDE